MATIPAMFILVGVTIIHTDITGLTDILIHGMLIGAITAMITIIRIIIMVITHLTGVTGGDMEIRIITEMLIIKRGLLASAPVQFEILHAARLLEVQDQRNQIPNHYQNQAGLPERKLINPKRQKHGEVNLPER